MLILKNNTFYLFFKTREEIPMSFSGLFPKNGSGTKRKANDDADEFNKTENESTSKKPKVSEGYESEEDMFTDETDEKVDGENENEENVVEDELTPLDQITSNKDQDEEQENNNQNKSKKPKCPKKLQGLVSTNFVKIDLKHKNYIHGNKSKMTGAKWKRKVHGKFGKRN